MSAQSSIPPPSSGSVPTSMPVDPSSSRPDPGPRRSSSPRRVPGRAAGLAVLAVVAIAVAILLIAPGGKSGPAPFSPIASAAEKTASYPGFRMSITAKVDAGGQSFGMSGNGVFNGATNQGKLDLSTQGSPAGAFSMSEVFSGSTFYVSSPQLSAVIPSGANWIKVDVGDELSSKEADVGAFDPTQQIQELQGVSSDIRAVGSEMVGKAITTHYKGTIDSSALSDSLRDQGEDEAADSVESSGQTAPVDVWVDREGLLRRIDLAQDLSIQGTSARMAMSMTFSNYGIKPQIALPSDVETLDAGALSDLAG
jgi:hypothetical protein